MERNMDEEQREDASYPAKSDISLIIRIHYQNSVKTLFGYLMEMSRSSLILEYLPTDGNLKNIVDCRCRVTLKVTKSESRSFDVEGSIVNDGLSPRESFFGLRARRCKVVFLSQISLSEMEPFIRNQ